MKSSVEFSIAETASFQKLISHKKFATIYAKIRDYVYPQLKRNPYFGPNIKKLKGELSDFYRYRIGAYRLFYSIDGEQVIVFIVNLVHRKDAYR